MEPTTYALILLLAVASPDGARDVQESVIDSGLTVHECAVQWGAIEPSASLLPTGVLITLQPACEAER
jgi:hypothetical protein